MKNIFNFPNAALLLILAAGSCQKMDRPALGNYPKDPANPGGTLKFYTAFDGTDVDSIKANFGSKVNATFVAGINGQAMTAGANGYIKYGAANDVKTSSSFTVSFWLKKNGPNPAGSGTSFAFGLASSQAIWHKHEMFLLFEDAGNPSTMDSAAVKFNFGDQWFEFIGPKRMPKVLNNQWHHLVFSYDQSNSTLTTYIDGAPMAGLPANFGKFTNNGGVVDLSKAEGLVIGGPGHYAVNATPDSWMGNFNGQLDQFRIYNKALSASEVSALFTGKL